MEFIYSLPASIEVLFSRFDYNADLDTVQCILFYSVDRGLYPKWLTSEADCQPSGSLFDNDPVAAVFTFDRVKKDFQQTITETLNKM